MKYYFALGAYPEKIIEYGAKNILCSFAFKERIKYIFKYNIVNPIIDSGAFSLWNNNKSVDINKYVEFIKSLPSNFYYVNLDSIPPTFSPTRVIDEHAKISMNNFIYLKTILPDYNIIPVYHSGEDISYLKEYINLTKYIGISPDNNDTEKVKRVFLSKCFRLFYPDIKFHGFGYSSHSGLEIFPFYSCDSTTYSWLDTPNLKRKFRANTNCFYLLKKSVVKELKYENYITDLWKARGVVWDE